jgi:RHS repeat-associated protein
MSYGYNLAGLMVSETYPSQRQVTTSYDGAGRLSTVNGQKAGELNKSYAAGFSYTAAGAVSAMQMGNGLVEQTTFNARLQPVQIKLGTAASPSSVVQLDYGYGTTNNNGNLLSQTITAPKTTGGSLVLTQTYGYDALNRLVSAGENGMAWQQTYDMDRFGNRAVRATSYIPNPQLTPQSASLTDFSAFDQSSNRLSMTKYPQVLYDGAGNLKRDQVGSAFTYDGENRQLTASVGGTSASYFYEGDGRRVKKVVGSVTTVFVYNASGQMVAEYVNDPVPPPVGGGGTSYLTSDHLGSTRVVTRQDGSVKVRYDYLPYGEELPASIGGRSQVSGYGSVDSTRQKFTAKERDVESSLDYFLARYYSGAQGRFTSADEPLAGQQEDDPQSWNLFAYARNNPLIYVDPAGRDYQLVDPQGNPLGGPVKDASDLTKLGYKYLHSDKTGNILYFEGGYTAEYVEGKTWQSVEIYRFSDLSSGANRFITEMGRYAPASQKMIDIAADITLTPISIISGTAVFRSGIMSLGFLGPLEQPAGAKLGKMIGRFASIGGGASREAFMAHAGELITKAVEAGTYVEGTVGPNLGAKIFKVGEEYLVVSREGKLLSYVERGFSDGSGIVAKYRALGGQ